MSKELKSRGAGKKQGGFHREEESLVRLKHSSSKHEVQVDVTYYGEYPWVEIYQQGKKIFDGAWQCVVVQDEKVLVNDEGCGVACYSSDSDGDYLELTKDLGNGIQLDYILFLPKKYPYLLMASFINKPRVEGVVLESVLPNIVQKEKANAKKKYAWKTNTETRDLILEGGAYWQLLPVTVPQFRSRSNKCQVEVQDLDVLQRTEAGCLPQAHVNVLTWEEPKTKYPATWKQVDVGFGIRPVKEDQAVAWRFRIGKEQFLFYRSFVQMIQPRSAMGLHTNYECVISMLNKDGFHKSLISIQREEIVEG